MNVDAKRASMFLAIVLILALGLRLFHLSQRVLWFDEANSLLIAKASPSQIIDAVRDDTHSPFYYMVLHYWQSVASGENGARLLSVLAGVATIVVVYALGAALAGRGAGLLAAAFLALNPLHIWYSQEIRMYAVQTLLVTLSFLLMVTALRRDQVSVWVGYLIVTALSLYAQYASFYAVIAQNGFIVIYYRHDRPKLRHWFASQCAVMLLFAPWLPVFVSQARMAASSSWLEPLTASRVLAFFSLLSGNYLGDAHGRVVSELITVVALIAPVVILWRRESRPMASMLLLWFLLPVSLLIVQSLNQNRFLPRVLLCTTPAFALMLGCAITQSGRTMARVVVTFIGVALLASNAFALRNYYFSENGWVKSDLRDATTKLAVEIEPGDIVVHLSEHSLRPFQCYLGSGVAEGVIDTPVYQSHLFAVTGDGRLPQSTAGYKRIWLVLYPDQFHRDLAETARDWMNQHHHFLRALHESNTVFVGLYERRDPQLAPTHH